MCTPYSARQLKWWSTFELLAWLLSHSGCSSAYDNQLGSYMHQTVPKAAIKTCTYGHSKLRNSNFSFEKKLWYFDISSLDECNFFKKWNFLPQYHFKFIETYSAFTFCSQELAILCFWAWNWHFWKKLHSSNHGTIEYQSFFSKLKFGYLSLLWPYLWVFMTSIGNISWVWDPSWLSCALEQPEWLISLARS